MKIRPQKNAVMNLPLFCASFSFRIVFPLLLVGFYFNLLLFTYPLSFYLLLSCAFTFFSTSFAQLGFSFSLLLLLPRASSPSYSSSSSSSLPLQLLQFSGFASSFLRRVFIRIGCSRLLSPPFFSPLVCFVFSETKREFHAPPVIRFVFLRWNLFQARASGSSYCNWLSLMDC